MSANIDGTCKTSKIYKNKMNGEKGNDQKLGLLYFNTENTDFGREWGLNY